MQLFKNLFSKPLKVTLTVSSANGFHLRPLARFATLAKTFPCDVKIATHTNAVDAKKVNTLLALSLAQGDSFVLSTQGKEAQKALHALESLFRELMKEEVSMETLHKKSSSYEGEHIEAEIIAQGVVIAPAYPYQTTSTQKHTLLSYDEALHKTLKHLEHLAQEEKNPTHAEIYMAQKVLLETLGGECHSLEMLEEAIQKASKALQNTTLASKISDYQDILQHFKQTLGETVSLVLPSKDCILLADDLLPSEISLLSQSSIKGVILKETAIYSHTSILLRSLGIPSVIADTTKLTSKEHIILDGFAGCVVYAPSTHDLTHAKALEKDAKEQEKTSNSKRFEPAQTVGGNTIKVFANVGDIASAKLAKEEGAEGIGLLRSEFLFQSVKPTLKEQVDAYSTIFSYFDDICVRTLDVGGDKALPYLHIPPEENPFLGVRGVRLFRTHPDILQEQLLAIFKAAQGQRIKVMFPMVSSVEEFVNAKALAQEIAQKHTLDISNIAFGIMVEVPSVLFSLEEFNAVVDFYSIGTNDLTQYLFATERTHLLLKVDVLSPVVFKALKMVQTQATKPVSICGELAANRAAIDRLIDLGLTTLSVNPKNIAQVKEHIRHV